MEKETMTMTDQKDAPGAREFVVQDDKEGAWCFQGEVIADLSWTYEAAREAGHDRWTDLTLFHVLKSTSGYKYAIQTVGRSVLYHRPGGPCRYGVSTTVSLLLQDTQRYEALMPCQEKGCEPLDLEDYDGNAVISVEQNRYTGGYYHTAKQVVEEMQRRMTRERRRDNKPTLSMKFLQAAADVDSDIREALLEPRRL